MEKTDWKRIGWLTAATLVLGAIIGACAGLLTLLLYGVEYVMLGFIESEFIPGAFTVPAVRRIASVTLGLGVAGVIWYLLRTKTEKVPSVKKAVNGGRMPFWQTIVHVVLQIFIVGSGAPSGARSRRASWAPCWRSGSATSSISVTAKATRMACSIAAWSSPSPPVPVWEACTTRRWPACSSRWRYCSST